MSVLSFGAVGDGRTDDSVAIQRALDGLVPGSTLVFPAGQVFAHSAVLRVRVAGVRITGGGTLLATNEQSSAVFIDASDVTLDHLSLATQATTKRWAEFEKMGLRVYRTSGVTVSDVTIDGSGSAGLYVGRSSGFTIARVTVRNTRSDGIHMSEGSRDGTVTDVLVQNPRR